MNKRSFENARVWRVGADVDTDALAPGAYMKHGLEVIGWHCLEAVRGDFASGVREGDVILSFGDRPIASVQDLTRAVADTKAGTTRDMRIIRDGRNQTLKVNIAALKDDVQRPQLASAAPSPPRGSVMEMADLGLTLGVNGSDVVVTAVKVNSPAAEAGIRTGDKLVKVNQTQPASPEAARKAVDDAKKANGQAVLLQLERQGTKYFVGVPFSG
jgi:S1-C subfamily serine protease